MLVSDGANDNYLANNAAFGNAVYDIELAGDSLRFGFFTPTSFGNVVAVGRNSSAKVKDCGEANIVNGVTVDNDADPCF